MEHLKGEFQTAMLRLSLNAGNSLSSSSSKEQLQLLSDQLYTRVKSLIQDKFHLERALDRLLSTTTRVPSEVHWRKALYDTKTFKEKKTELPPVSEGGGLKAWRLELYKTIQKKDKTAYDERVLATAERIYGSNALWQAYERWVETGEDTLGKYTSGQVLRKLAGKNSDKGHEAGEAS